MKLFLDTAATLYEAKDFYEIGITIVSIIKNISKAQLIGGKIGIYNKETDEYQIYYNSEDEGDREKLKEIYHNIFIPKKFHEITYFSRIVADTKKILLIQDSHSPESLRIYPGLQKVKPHSMLWIPLLYKNEFLGIISLGSEPINSFTDEIIDSIQSISKIISIKIFEILTSSRLVKSEERYRNLAENADDAIVLTDLTGIFIYRNPSYYKGLGYETGEDIGNNGIAFVHPDDIRRIQEELSKVKKKKVLSGEYRVKHKDGSWRFRQIKTVLINETENEPGQLLSIIRDITEQKQVEEALISSEQKFRNFIAQASEGFLLTNEEGMIIESNSTIENILNLSRDKIRKKFIWDLLLIVIPSELLQSDQYNIMKNAIIHSINTGSSPFFNRPIDGIIKSKEQEIRYIQHTIFPIKTDKGYRLGSVIRDITEIKKSEKKLRENEERYRILAEQTGQIIYDWNLDTGIILWTGLIQQITGFTFEEFQKVDIRRWELLIHPDDRKRTKELLNSSIETGSKFCAEYRFQKKEGIYFYVEDSGVFLNDAKNRISRMIGTLKDISERKAAEESLFTSARQWQTTFDAVNDAIWLLDSNGYILRSNRSTKNLFGLNPEQVQGKYCCSILHNSETSLPGCPLDKMKISLHRESIEIYRDNKWNNITVDPIYDENHNLTGAVLIVSDITSKKRAEDERDRFFSYSIDMLSISGFDGYFKQINPAWSKCLGWTEEDILTKPYIALVHPDDIRAMLSITEKMQNGKPVIGFENRYRCKDGTYRWFEWNAFPFITDGLIFGVTRDVTKNKESESEQLRLQNLESLGILAGGIAHDFNNILTSIMGQASIALIRSNDENSKKSISGILEAAKRAVGLTNQLLTFAKGGTPQKSIIKIRKLIEETTQFSLSGSNVQPHFDFNDTHGLEADAGQIAQVIQNIVINAKQAMPNGGNLHILTQDGSLNTEDYTIEIIIRDSGIGIPKEYLEKVFDPYFTTKQSGSGLGLSVCHSIINRHGGSIIVESKPGNGSTFKIILPAIAKDEEYSSLNHQLVQPNLKILIMDDEQTIREILREILIELGHNVTDSTNGSEAIDLYKRSLEENTPYDIVFLDLTIRGGLGGKETIKFLRKINPFIRVVVSSGYADSSVSNYKEDGFNAKLNKPYTLEQVNEVLFHLLNN